MKNKSTLITGFLVLFFTIASSASHAARYEKTGLVQEIVVAQSASNDANSNLAVLNLEGFSSAGDCYVASLGLVAMRILNNAQGRAQLALLTAANMSRTKVQVRVDDTDKDSDNYCYLQQIRMNPDF